VNEHTCMTPGSTPEPDQSEHKCIVQEASVSYTSVSYKRPTSHNGPTRVTKAHALPLASF